MIGSTGWADVVGCEMVVKRPVAKGIEPEYVKVEE